AEEQERIKGCLECEMEFRNGLQVHLDFYNELLVNRYAPKQVKYWQSVRKERDLLQKKLNESIMKGKFPQLEQDEKWIEQHRTLQENFKQAVEKRDEQGLRDILPLLIEH